MDSSDDKQENFFKHVFNFDDDSKSDMLNIIQYSLIAIVPIIILNKSMSKYVPEADDNKGSLEVSIEIILQIIVMFIGLLIIHRVITFIPTYSGSKYAEFNVIFIILGVLMITMSLQTKLGEKVSLLFDRVSELWNGKTETKQPSKNNGNVKIIQPISGQNLNNISMPTYNDSTSINSLPNNNSAQQIALSPQQLPDYNAMHSRDTNPLLNAASPGQTEGFSEPMAANESSGGFGSW
jgi:hypothetical protein